MKKLFAVLCIAFVVAMLVVPTFAFGYDSDNIQSFVLPSLSVKFVSGDVSVYSEMGGYKTSGTTESDIYSYQGDSIQTDQNVTVNGSLVSVTQSFYSDLYTLEAGDTIIVEGASMSSGMLYVPYLAARYSVTYSVLGSEGYITDFVDAGTFDGTTDSQSIPLSRGPTLNVRIVFTLTSAWDIFDSIESIRYDNSASAYVSFRQSMSSFVRSYGSSVGASEYLRGYDKGYLEGVSADGTEGLGIFDWIGSVLGGVFDVPILGTFTLGDIFISVFGIIVIVCALKFFAGG